MEEQKEQIKDPADTAETSVNKIPVVEEQPPEPVRRKKAGGEEDRFGRKAKIAFEKSSDSEPVEEVISINRITKVTKGGKKLSFSALVVVGDTKGRVGYSLEKAAEVSIAIRKSIASAKKQMINVSLSGSTIPHEIIGRCGGATVLLKPAADGTGVIAAGPVRAVCDGVGIRNILTKCHRSNNPINVVKATMDGLSRLKSGNNLKKA
ncbi:MAG TPA: 30S ribosomal protein S5 [Candidatus Omnitrophica bacterium]|nr:30S ribosomal protein S5 [Candidatus Omnitrophota bacterium]HCI44830.1 30S ribosomal protein S5 [Candidatus Omnitrophota bacterium]